jgi:2,4-dichlorophenol 6-monooxygenase
VDVSLNNAMRLGEVYQALASGNREQIAAAIANQAEHFDMFGLQLGFAYASGALVADDGEQPARTLSIRDYVPSALPGARVPHTWVTRAGVRVSTLDLFAYGRFTLVTGPAGERWTEAAAGPVPCDYLTIGRDIDDADGQWMTLLDIEPDGALLVRPDQHVAWRSRHGVTDPVGTVARALASILSSNPHRTEQTR